MRPRASIKRDGEPEKPIADNEIDAILARLRSPDSEVSGRVAADVVFLYAAARQRDNDAEGTWRTEWSRIVAELIRSLATAPRDGSVGAIEAPLLRICTCVVERLAQHQQIGVREGLWLAYRLFQWVVSLLSIEQQRELVAAAGDSKRVTPPTPEVLDPIRFGHAAYNFRLAAVLLAIYNAHGAVGEPGARPALWSDGISQALLDVVNQPFIEAERQLRRIESPERSLAWNLRVAATRDIAALLLVLFDQSRLDGVRDDVVKEMVEAAVADGAATSQRAQLAELAMSIGLRRPSVIAAADRGRLAEAMVNLAPLMPPSAALAYEILLYGLGESSLRDRVIHRALTGSIPQQQALALFFSVVAPEHLAEELSVVRAASAAQTAVVAALADAADVRTIDFVAAAEAILLAEASDEGLAALDRLRRRRTVLEASA